MRRENAFLFLLLGLMSILIVFSIASLATWFWNIFDYSFPFVDISYWRYALIDLQLFNVFYPWVPWLFIALLFSWIWIPSAKVIVNRLAMRRVKFKLEQLPVHFDFVQLRFKTLFICLLAIVGVALIVSSVSLLYHLWFKLGRF